MDDLLADFVAETREMLENSEGELIVWEANPSDRQRLDTIFRFVHTVKGNCGFFDLPRLAALSHAAEGALAEVRADRREANADLVSAVLAIIDRIMEMIDAIEAGDVMPFDDDDLLIAALEVGASATGPARSNPQPVSPSIAKARSIRVPVEMLDELMSGVSDMVLARNDLARRIRSSGDISEIESTFERLSGILGDVRETVTRMRMNPIEHLYQAIPRLVRDLAQELGKKVSIAFDGGHVELDREVLELVRDPLTHILRNAIDHGIEGPDERLLAGKPTSGQISISARHAGNEIRVTISDDGRGIDPEAIARQAIKSGIRKADTVAGLTGAQKLDLIFEPGLSTASKVSEISGRGVGMDVVRANLEKIGGRIIVSSVPGEGTDLEFRIPLTLSIMAGLTVRVGTQQFAIPQTAIVEIVRCRSTQTVFSFLGERRIVTIRSERLPYLSLAAGLNISPPGADEDIDGQHTPTVIIVADLANSHRVAIGVDSIGDYEDLVIKPLPPQIMETGFYSGSTLLNDGRPILMLDLRELAALCGMCERGGSDNSLLLADDADKAGSNLALMAFTGLDGTEHAVRVSAVQRVDCFAAGQIDRTGNTAMVVLDGIALPLLGLPQGDLQEGAVHAIRMNDGTSQLLFASHKAIRWIDIDPSALETSPEREVEATIVHNDRIVRLIDTHRLFGQLDASRGRVRHRPTCRIPDDEWSRQILAPLLNSTGYAVVEGVTRDVDLAILIDADEMEQADASAKAVVRLTSDPKGTSRSMIDRYDRERILAALEAARKDVA